MGTRVTDAELVGAVLVLAALAVEGAPRTALAAIEVAELAAGAGLVSGIARRDAQTFAPIGARVASAGVARELAVLVGTALLVVRASWPALAGGQVAVAQPRARG